MYSPATQSDTIERKPVQFGFSSEGDGSSGGASERGGSCQSRDDESTIRILVIDDDVAFLDAAKRALSNAAVSFDVTTAETGTSAIAALVASTQLPDFIVLDYHLPDTTAPSLLERFAADPVLRAIPVLVVTRDGRESAREQVLLAGATDFASKPSRVSALRDLVTRFWETHGPRADDPTD